MIHGAVLAFASDTTASPFSRLVDRPPKMSNRRCFVSPPRRMRSISDGIPDASFIIMSRASPLPQPDGPTNMTYKFGYTCFFSFSSQTRSASAAATSARQAHR